MADVRDNFERQLTTAMRVVIASAILTSGIGLVDVGAVWAGQDRIVNMYTESSLLFTQLETFLQRRSAQVDEFLFTGDEAALSDSRAQREAFLASLPELRARTSTVEGLALLARIEAAEHRYAASIDHAVGLRRGGAGNTAMQYAFEDEVAPVKRDLDRDLYAFESRKHQQLGAAQEASDGAKRRALVVAFAVAALAGIVAFALARLLRVTIRKLAEERARLTATLVLVEASNRDLEAFAGRVAHDVRDALAPVGMASTLLRQCTRSDDKNATHLRRIERCVRRALDTVDALLAFSRAGAEVDPHVATSVRSVVAEVVEELRPKLAEADATVMTTIEDAEVRCPPGLLNILIANLLGNAVKYVRDRTDRSIRITGALLLGGYEIRVDDRGPGIPERELARIFEPFHRVPGTTAPGTGIGLATVARIADAYGGRVTVESTLSAGSTFRVWLPRPEPE